MKRLLCLVVLVMTTLSTGVWADAPSMIPVQGRLTDTAGAGPNDVFAVTFTLYSDAEGTASVWTEETPVNFIDGYFTAYLGASTALDLAVFRDNSALFLGVKIGDDEEMQPFEIATSPYAGFAQYAGFAGDITDAAKVQIVGDVAVQLDNDGKVHDKYTDAEAIAAVTSALSTDTTQLEAALGSEDDANPLNHARYTNAEAVAALAGHTGDPAAHHARYTDDEARAAVVAAALPAGDIAMTGNLTGAANVLSGTTYAKKVRIQSRGLSSTLGASTISIDGQLVHTTTRSYGLVVLERATGNVVFNGTFDVYGDPANAQAMATELAKYSTDHIVVVNTHDEPSRNRTTAELAEQMRRCGAGGAFLNPAFRSRAAYGLIGICDTGAGSGLEFYSGDVNSDTSAFVDATIPVIDGNFNAPFSIQPRVLRTTDPRSPGCPPAHAANTDLFTQTFTLTRASQVVVRGDMIRNLAGRSDLQLYRNSTNPDGSDGGTDVLLDQTLTYTPTAEWLDGHVTWVGVLQPGTHVLSLRGTTADHWGCGNTWGSIDTILYE